MGPVILVLFLGAAGLGHGAVLALWNMNDINELANGTTVVTKEVLTGTPTLVLVGGSVDLDGQAGTAYTDTDGQLHAADVAAAWQSGVDDGPPNYFLATLNTIGVQLEFVRYDYRSTGTGSPNSLFEYRVGGVGGWTMFGADSYAQDSAFHSISNTLSGVAAIQNQSMVELRWTLTAGSGSGTFRSDNLEFGGFIDGGSAVPEPGSLGLAGMAVVLIGCLRRRKDFFRLERAD